MGAGRAAAVSRPGVCEVGRDGWPPGSVLRLARLGERPLRERAKAKRAAAGAARGRLVSLLRAEQARRLDCGLLQRLAAGVEAALADAAPLELGEELRGRLRAELATPGELEGLLERLDGHVGALEALEEELLEALRPLVQGRPAIEQKLAQAEVTWLEGVLGDRRAEELMRRRLAEAADEKERIEHDRAAGVYAAEAELRVSQDALGALAEAATDGDEPGQAEKLAELEEDLVRAERVLAETENRAAKQWAVMVEQ